MGGILKLAYLALLVWLGYKLYRAIRGPTAAGGPHRAPSAPGGRIEGGELVQDPHCGVYVPKETAVRGGAGQYFCSEACRDAHRAKGG